jgi:hypothetical protein
MEVHQHSHTPRKKWTHYFWEFLMLFLAVYCGFLAENQREHMVEHQREKQYMRSLLEDLQTDTTSIATVIKRAVLQKAQLDSLIELGNYSAMDSGNIQKFYMLHGKTIRFLNIHLEDRTTSQLKNAGGMRLIRNTEVSTAIRQYWNQQDMIYTIRERLESAGEKIADVSTRIFFKKYFIPGKEPLDPPLGIKPGAIFIDGDPKLIAEYINRVATKSLRTGVYLAELGTALKQATELMELIKKGYRLK